MLPAAQRKRAAKRSEPSSRYSSHLPTNAFAAPRSLAEEGEAKAPTLEQVLQMAGVPHLLPAFRAQDIYSLDDADSLTVDDVRSVLVAHEPKLTIGLMHRVHKCIQQASHCAQATAKRSAQLKAMELSPTSVLPRTMLQLGASDLKDALTSRLGAESVYASLMLTVSVAALITPPTDESDRQRCVAEYGVSACDVLLRCYLISWMVASVCYMNACTVGLGAIQLFYGISSHDNVHFMFVKGDKYMALSFLFISLGLMLGLLPGICLLGFTRFPEYPAANAALSVVAWALWFFQFVRGYTAIHSIYQNFPGYGGVLSFMQGYFSICPTLRPVGPEAQTITRNTQDAWARRRSAMRIDGETSEQPEASSRQGLAPGVRPDRPESRVQWGENAVVGSVVV